MSAPSFGERLLISRLALGTMTAALSSRLVKAPPASWQLVRPRADSLLLVPPDLRPTDPSLADEMAGGEMGLGGAVVDLGGGSPFVVPPPTTAWARELNGFVWLGSLRAAGGDYALGAARQLVADWCRRNRGRAGGRGIAAEPQVIARRVTAWVANAGFLLEDADAAFYRTFTSALGAELRALDAATRRARPGYPRLACLMALTTACVAIDGHDIALKHAERRLAAELARQILPDGGHVTRNPEIVLDILLDLLPIRQCYGARKRAVPEAVDVAANRMLGHLRLMMLAAGTLARFNGVGCARDDVLATVLAAEGQPRRAPTTMPGASGYARLERQGTVVIVDCGRTPPLALSGSAHAGALSFELSHGDNRIIANGGAPGAVHRTATADARATDSHSTLVLNDQSSARLVRSRRLERVIGGPGLAGPDNVTASLTEKDGAVELIAVHDGYLGRYGILHERRLVLSSNGRVLAGTDVLRPPTGSLRLAHDVPLAIRFHVAAGARISAERSGDMVIEPTSGPAWRLSANGGRIGIEAGTDYAQPQGPAPARQAVIRAATPGETTITWLLQLA